MIGNALEWYDYALYAQFFTIIGRHFFPESMDPEIKQILTAVIFAAGFIVRPLGGVVFGHIGDRFGRKAALVMGILTMTIPTAAIGLLPSYAAIGLAAPIILTFIRMLQGFSLGGEFSACISYIVEHASMKNRGLAGSASFVSMCLGMLFGVATAQAFYHLMPEDYLVDWGWRIPFIAGFFIGVIGLYIRKNLSESPIYKAAKETGNLSERPFREALAKNWSQILIAMGIYATVTAPFYTATVYIKTFMQDLGYSQNQASLTSAVILITMCIVLPIAAAISDVYGRRPLLIIGTWAMIILAYPIFVALGSMNFVAALISQIVFAAINAIYMGCVPTVLVELFPTRVRFTGVALSYNISAAVFGGFATAIGLLLNKMTGDKYAISYYLIILAFATLITLRFYKETYRKVLAL